MRIGSTSGACCRAASRWTTARQRVALLALALLGLGAPAWAQSEAGLGMAPRTSAGSSRLVLEREWAAWLTRTLGLERLFPEPPPVEERFALLCGERAVEEATGSLRRVQDATPGVGGSARYRVELAATGLYRLAVEGRGRQRWLVDGQVVEHLEPGSVGVAMTSALLPLRRGTHELEVFTGRRGRVDRLDLSVVRSLCIAPVDGWHAERPLTYAAAARTLVRAMGLVALLPPRGEPIRIDGRGSGAPMEGSLPASASAHASVRERDLAADGAGAALREYPVQVLEPGLHSIEARVRGLGDQIWSLDDRYRSRVRVGGDGERDVAVMHVPLARGEHVIRVLLPTDARVDEIRLTRRGSRGGDELSVIGRLGLRTRAPLAPVTVAEANELLDAAVVGERARRFLRNEGLRGAAGPVVLGERPVESQGRRPLSPALPAEL